MLMVFFTALMNEELCHLLRRIQKSIPRSVRFVCRGEEKGSTGLIRLFSEDGFMYVILISYMLTIFEKTDFRRF